MKNRFDREDLLRRLEAVVPGLTTKDTVDQSSCFLFLDGSLVTYDDETLCRAPSPLGKAFAGAVTAANFLEVLRREKDKEVTVTPGEGHLLVRGSGWRLRLVLQAEVSSPAVAFTEEPARWRPIPEGFREALDTVAACAAPTDKRFEATCVHFHPDWLEAGTNVQLCRWPLKTGLKQPTLVRASSVKHVAKAIGLEEWGRSDNWLHFRGRELLIACRRFVDPYPDVGEFLQAPDGVPVTFPKTVAEAADTAGLFSQETAETSMNMVRLDLSPHKGGRLRVTGEGVSAEYSKGKRIGYRGKPLSCYIPPQLLMDLVNRHNECVVAPDRLLVDVGHYRWATCLMRPEASNGDGGDDGGNTDEGSGND